MVESNVHASTFQECCHLGLCDSYIRVTQGSVIDNRYVEFARLQTQRVGQVTRIIQYIGVPIQRLWIGEVAWSTVRRQEASEAIYVVASHREVVAGFGVALIRGEEQFVIGGVVPGFTERKMAKLGGCVPAGVGDKAVREVILMVILRARRIDLGEQGGAGVDVLSGGGADGSTVIVFGKHFASRKYIHRARGGAVWKTFLHTKAVAVVVVSC